ncbi:9433_t:CDS:2, partial [Ambispora leptoticha]
KCLKIIASLDDNEETAAKMPCMKQLPCFKMRTKEGQVEDLEYEVESATFCIGAVQAGNWERNIQYANLVTERSVLRAEIENLRDLIDSISVPNE